MKKGLTELVFILDRSGSMSGLASDTIGGFNSTIRPPAAAAAADRAVRASASPRSRHSYL